MDMTDERWLTLVDSFGAAAVNTDTWPAALAALAHATGSRSGQLIGLGSPNVVPFNWATDLDPDWATEFLANGGGDPTRNPMVRAAATAGELQVLQSAQFIAPEEQRRNDFIQWYERRHDLSRICLTPLVKGGDRHVGLAVMRSRSQGEITRQERAVFASIAPHVRAAVQMQISLEHQGALLIAGAMEALAVSVFVCDRNGTVRAMTPLAESMLRGANALRLRNGKLCAHLEVDTRALSQAIEIAARGVTKPGATAAQTIVVRDQALLPLALEVAPLPRREHAFGFEPRALVIARRVQANPDRARTLLKSAFGLTDSEAQVALRLAEGDAPEAIAKARGVKVSTIRVQIRAIFAKFDVHRLGELAAKVQSLQ